MDKNELEKTGEIATVSDSPTNKRRRRFERTVGEGCVLTPKKQALLLHLSQCRLLSLPQLAALEDLTEKAARKHLRAMFDSGFVQIVAVPRSVLVDTDTPNDPSLMYGSAPNIYQPTKEGLRLLWELGKIEREERDRVAVPYGPKNATFLAHEVQVRDIRVWLERCRRWHQGTLNHWRDNGDAMFDLSALKLSGIRSVRPDAWFTYKFPSGNSLVGLVEIDRGTERGVTKWREKLTQYRALLGPGKQVFQEAVGFKRWRVLVVVPTEARREWLVRCIAEEAKDDELSQRFWITTRAELVDIKNGFTSPIWRQVGTGTPKPMVTPEMLRIV